MTDVGDRAQRTMPSAVWRRLVAEALGGRNVSAEDGTALPDEARCRAARAQYAVFATFDRAMRLPGLAQENDRLYGVARFTVRNCATGAVLPAKIVRVESEPLPPSIPDEADANAQRAWVSAIHTALARDPVAFTAHAPLAHALATRAPASGSPAAAPIAASSAVAASAVVAGSPVVAASTASPAARNARIARVVNVEGNEVFIDNTGAFSVNQVLRAYADRNGKPYAEPVELVVLEIDGRFVIAGIVGKNGPRVGDRVDALPPGEPKQP